MSQLSCPNRTFHESQDGKNLASSYTQWGFLWILDKKETKVECAVCLHADDLENEFGKETSIFKEVLLKWNKCTHKKIVLSKGPFLCNTCFICVQ